MQTPEFFPIDARRRGMGFTLIEVLVTLMIISLALLGTFGLQSYALKTNRAAQYRAQAVALASDLAERIDANPVAAMAGRYAYVCPAPALPRSGSCGPSGDSCTPTDLATHDLLDWQAEVATALPGASCSVMHGDSANPTSYSIVLRWVDRKADGLYAPSAAGNTGEGEALVYQSNRSVSN